MGRGKEAEGRRKKTEDRGYEAEGGLRNLKAEERKTERRKTKLKGTVSQDF